MQNEDSRPAPRDEVLFDIEMALRKEEKLWPKRPRPGDHNRFRPLARGILEHLELCGLRFARKPPARNTARRIPGAAPGPGPTGAETGPPVPAGGPTVPSKC